MVWLVIVWTIVFVVLLAIFILFFPLTINFDSIRSGGRIKGNFSISWLMFLVKYSIETKKVKILFFRIKVFSFTQKEKNGQKEKKKPDEKKIPEVSKISRLPGLNILNLAGPVFKLLKGALSAFKFKYLDVGITYGLNDPACTGMLTGFLNSTCITSHVRKLTPDFTRSVLDWDLEARVSFTPVKLVLPIAKFVTNIQVLRFVIWNIRN